MHALTNQEFVEIDGCMINTVQVVKLLGFYIQGDINLNSHVTEMQKKSCQTLSATKECTMTT